MHFLSSHWTLGDDWYRLPAARVEADAQEELVQAFTPAGVRESEPLRTLFKFEEPSSILRAVDDALVERLDSWREKAVRCSRGAITTVDGKLQTLYAQLFVLRTIEDRSLDDTIRPVLEATPSPEVFDRDIWGTIFARAQEQVGSDLFDEDVTVDMDPFILNGVIRDLYYPKRIPGKNVRYDFSWISADVLGLAYEKYLSTVLQPAPLPAQNDLFQEAQRGVERQSVRKSAGAYYTPRFLTTYLASTCVRRFYQTADKFDLPRVIDFSCGSGSFLVAAVDQILAHLKSHDSSRQWARELVDGGFIAGIDIDPKAVTAARLHLWQRLIEEPGALPLPNLSDVIRAGDGLDSNTWGPLAREYDIVLGNPPFLATHMVTNRERLEQEFETAKGRYDFSSLFVEQALKILKECLVIPNRLFLNKSAEPLRRVLTQSAAIDVVLDFGSTKIFDADAYVGCIVATPSSQPYNERSATRVIQVRSMDLAYMTAELLSAESGDRGNKSAAVHSYLARQPGSAPWTLLSASEQQIRIVMEEASIRLDAIATVAQGIRTGANDLFILELEEEDGTSLARVRNGLGDQWFVESELLEFAIFGPELQRYSETHPTKRILYPYKNNAPIPETELKDKYPRAYEYFWSYRDLLSARSSLRGTGANYYELIRPRDERWLRSPKLLIRDLAPATAFAIDRRGDAFLIAGTAVIPSDPELCLPLAAYLNSTLVNNLIKQQTPSFRGDFQKFEPGVLSSIPLLNAVFDDETVLDQLRSLAFHRLGSTAEASEIEKEIDLVIMSAAAAVGIDLTL